MKIQYEITSNFNKYEYDINTKILLNICNTTDYGVTDTNVFYARFYNKIEKEFIKHTYNNKFGNISFCNIFTYHIVCNMFCVDWPKTIYNLTPFKINCFKTCCLKLAEYMSSNKIDYILSPVFGTEILQGDWREIISVMNDIFPENTKYIVFK